MCFDLAIDSMIESEESSIIYDDLYGVGQDKSIDPVRNLITAILENAIRDAWRQPVYGVSCPNRQALSWLHITSPLEKEDLEDPLPFTFVWVVEVLGYDPIDLHQKIKATVTQNKTFKLEQRRIR